MELNAVNQLTMGDVFPLMNSDDWFERLCGEYFELQMRIGKLMNFLDSRVIEANENLLVIQLSAMNTYASVLETRIVKEFNK